MFRQRRCIQYEKSIYRRQRRHNGAAYPRPSGSERRYKAHRITRGEAKGYSGEAQGAELCGYLLPLPARRRRDRSGGAGGAGGSGGDGGDGGSGGGSGVGVDDDNSKSFWSILKGIVAFFKALLDGEDGLFPVIAAFFEFIPASFWTVVIGAVVIIAVISIYRLLKKS